MRSILKAAEKAAHSTAEQITKNVRNQALASGWSPEVVSNVSIKHVNGSFKVEIHPDYADRAFVHEYGDETTPPTAVLRKHANNKAETTKVYNEMLKRHFGGK